MKPDFLLVFFCSHEQQGQMCAYLRSSRCPSCRIVQEMCCRKTGQKMNDKPGPGGARFASNFESIVWAAFSDNDGNKASEKFKEEHFPFGFGALPQKLKDNLRLSCFTCRGLSNNQKLTTTIKQKGLNVDIIANEYQKGFDIASHMVSTVPCVQVITCLSCSTCSYHQMFWRCRSTSCLNPVIL